LFQLHLLRQLWHSLPVHLPRLSQELLRLLLEARLLPD
jgi:hypothetical protein